MKSILSFVVVLLAATGGSALPSSLALAQGQYCFVQCQNTQGHKVGKKISVPVSGGVGCVVGGKKAVRNQCKGTGRVTYGSCYARIVNNKTVEYQTTGC